MYYAFTFEDPVPSEDLEMLWVRNFQSAVLFNEALLKLHATFILEALGAGGFDVNVVCMTNRAIQALNQRYRGIDQPTDVLSFPYHEVKAQCIRIA